jgi:hypothetical protein
MMRYVLIVALSAGVIGCRAPAPSLDVLAPYGSAVVPPPGTGTVGTLGNYYGPAQQGAAAPTAIPTAPMAAPPQQLVPPPASAAPGIAPVPPSGVAPASFQFDATPVIAPLSGGSHVDEQVRPATSSSVPSADDSNPLRLNGMPVSDATAYEDPSSFPSAGNSAGTAGQTPTAGNAPSFLRFINPKPAPAASSAAVPVAPPASAAWQAR